MELRVAEVSAALECVLDRLKASRVEIPPDSGWYRVLRETDRVGLMATANALEALTEAGEPPERPDEIVRTITRRQRPDGSWSFVTNLHDEGVVDATASAVLALRTQTDAASEAAVARGLAWLETSALTSGGWGLLPTGLLRSATTAVVVRAFAAAGRADHPAAKAGLRRLLAECDTNTGAWTDGRGQLSVATTSECLRAIVAMSGQGATFAGVRDKAIAWLVETGRTTSGWATGDLLGRHEEVTVQSTLGPRRVDYGYSPRALAVVALVQAGKSEEAAVLRAAKALVSDVMNDDWRAYGHASRTEPTSWMLYDAAQALVALRSALARQAAIVWVGHRRVVHHSQDTTAVKRWIRQYWPALILAAVITSLLVGLREQSVIDTKMLLAIGGTLMLGLVTNLVYDYVKAFRS